VKIEHLPAINALLNSTSTVLLFVGYLTIRRRGADRGVRAHAYLMLSALVVSATFLVSYLIYHYHVGEKSTKNMGLPIWLWLTYVSILFPHLVLAMVMLPMIFMTLYRAYQRQWERHRAIARPTFWIWLYVSVSGVVIYWMLYHLFPKMTASQ
jgi:putative membrane protein